MSLINSVFAVNNSIHSNGDVFDSTLLQQMLTPGGNADMAAPTIDNAGHVNDAGVNTMAARYSEQMGSFIQQTGVNTSTASHFIQGSVGFTLERFGVDLGAGYKAALQKATESKDVTNMQTVAYQAVTSAAAQAAERHSGWTPTQKRDFVGRTVSDFTGHLVMEMKTAVEKGYGADRLKPGDQSPTTPSNVRGNMENQSPGHRG